MYLKYLDRRIILAIIVASASISAVLLYFNFTNTGEDSMTNGEEPINVENVGGKYHAILGFWEDHVVIEYTEEEGDHTGGYFDVDRSHT